MATTPEPRSGLLLVDKPAGPTSHDAVAIARRALGTRRIGHTGTLDPFASGLLILCIGAATRLAEYLGSLPKTYRAVLRLGERTDTDDLTGTVIARSDDWQQVTREQVEAALRRRVGRQLQVPPGFSAKKVGGERLYQKARRGEAVAPAAVEIEVLELSLTSWDPPLAGFETTCSSGTYIRAIARDTGADLGCGAHLVELRRTAIGQHLVSAAVALEELQQGPFGGRLLNPLAALAHLPRVEVDDIAAAALRHGRPIPSPTTLTAPAVLAARGDELVAVGSAADGRLQPIKVFDG